MSLTLATALIISAAISAGVSGGKAIAGGIQKKRGQKQVDKALEGLSYTRPEEADEILSLLGKRKDTLGSRQDSIEEMIKGSTSRGITGISQLADSPVAALGAFGGLKDRETQAIKELGIAFDDKRDQALMGEVAGLEMSAGYSDKEQYYNDMYKKMVQMNMGAGKIGAGTQQLWSGLEGVASAGIDYAGTRYLGEIYGGDKTAEIDPGSANSPS